MDKIIAVPMKEVNGVTFGMKRDMVRKRLGDAKEFKKTKFSKTITDDFGFCHIFYNTNDECEAIEIFGNTEVSINGTIVFPTNIETVKKFISDLVEEEGTFISKNKSLAIYAPSGKMESILFGDSTYFD